MSDEEWVQRIRERAFQIWIEEGQPHGREKEHWALAEAEHGGQASPPLQPDQAIGEVTQAQDHAQQTQAPSIAGGTNPDDVTR